MRHSLLSSALSTLLVLAITVSATAQNPVKQSSKRLVVEFSSEIELRTFASLESSLKNQFPEFEKALVDLDVNYSLRPIITEKALNYLDQQAKKISGPSAAVQSLWRTFNLDLVNVDDADLDRIAAKLKTLSKIKTCYFKSKTPAPLPGDIAPTTPDMLSEQGYIESDPGVNMRYAWEMGITGKGINVRDIEVGVNTEHEELSEKNVSIADGMKVSLSATEDYIEHGTASIGVILADSGNYGTTGLQFGIDEMVSYPILTEEYGYDVTFAISEAIAHSETGDVIMYELQTYGLESPNKYVPQEVEADSWYLTKAATDAGIIIVAAAGNGDQDLDESVYAEYNNRGNSGAIIVGAGSPDELHEKMYFSTYGKRVDIQGWGINVVTTGYGDKYIFGGDYNQQYTSFSGTSSATPVVTSCVIALQSYYHNLTGDYLTGEEIKKILKETGIPQGGDATGNVGPLPNMKEALKALIDFMGIDESKTKVNFVLYPNPAADKLTITSFTLSPQQSLTISNNLGETIYSSTFNSRIELDLSDYPGGMYFIKVDNGRESLTQKLIKN